MRCRKKKSECGPLYFFPSSLFYYKKYERVFKIKEIQIEKEKNKALPEVSIIEYCVIGSGNR